MNTCVQCTVQLTRKLIMHVGRADARARARSREGIERAGRVAVSGGDRAMLLLLLLLHTPCVLSGSVEPAGPTAKLTLYHEFQPRFEHLGLANQDTGNATD